jgi:hypothetical protein
MFRAGDYRAQGKGLVTIEDLDRVVGAYNPSFHEAPVTVGHPKDNAPAFAWVEAVKREGDTLLYREKDADPQFCDARSKGRFKKRSASFYADGAGKMLGLRHVGWLGALPPEVKGLADVKFDEQKQFTEFAEADFEEGQVEKSMADQVKDAVGDLFRSMWGGADRGPKNFSEDDARRIATEAATAAAAPLQAKIVTLEASLATQATNFAERERKLAGGEVEQRASAAIAKLKAAGKWIPAFDKMGAPLLFAELARSTSTVEFGEEEVEGKKVAKKVAPLDLLVNFLEGLPKVVPAGTHFSGQAADRATVVDFGEKADPNSVQLHQLAQKRAGEKNISYGEALTQVAQENPNLTKPGNASAGAV